MSLPECSEEELQALYEWVDSVPLSRPKKNIARDFADGVLMAEIVHHYFPKLVELHNYSPAHNSVQKMYNWDTLNQKVFRRMGFALAREQQEVVANGEAGAIERVLKLVRVKMARFQEGGSRTAAAAAGTTAATTSSSHPGSPPHFVVANPAAVNAAADSITAVRLAAEVPTHQLAGGGAGSEQACFSTLDPALAASLADTEQQLEELRETNQILETKVCKLEQLVRLKDAKIQALLAKLQAAAGSGAADPVFLMQANA